MITHIQGRLVEKNPTDIVIDCNGVGYSINISLHTFSQLSSEENVKLYTHLQVREDSHTLYGFSSKLEREIFRLLISVSGVGASIARTMLSSLTPQQVMEAIAHNDLATIQSVKGIGLKTAQRLIVDLKDKVSKLEISSNNIFNLNNTNRNEAFTALSSLGFDKKSIERALDKSFEDSMTVEELIKASLKIL